MGEIILNKFGQRRIASDAAGSRESRGGSGRGSAVIENCKDSEYPCVRIGSNSIFLR